MYLKVHDYEYHSSKSTIIIHLWIIISLTKIYTVYNYNSACHCMASNHSRLPSFTQNHSEKSDNGSPAHTKSLASSNNKKHMFHLQFIISELQNFLFKVALSRTSNNKLDSVCNICLRYRTAFVIGCSRYCLPPIKF